MVTGVLSKCCNYPCLVWKNTLQQGIKLNTTWTSSTGAFSPLKVYRGLPMACMNLGGTNAVQFVGTGFFPAPPNCPAFVPPRFMQAMGNPL